MRTENILSTSHNSIYTKSCSIWIWDTHLAPVQGKYSVITHNLELADMQQVKPGFAHPICVMDDFGNLVRVPA